MANQSPTEMPLDNILYSLDPDGLAFFQKHTGIQDERKLKDHIIAVQRKAYQVSIDCPTQVLATDYAS